MHCFKVFETSVNEDDLLQSSVVAFPTPVCYLTYLLRSQAIASQIYTLTEKPVSVFEIS